MRETRRSGAIASVLCGVVTLAIATSCSVKQNGPASAPASGGVKQSVARPAATFVANPFCRACHVDFDEEPMVVIHKAAGIGCERCHGESLRHRSDEANITPPELMYPKERINPTCMACHPRHLIQTPSHRPLLEANLSVLETAPVNGPAGPYCTDCHGVEHRMKVRAVLWDKYTGKVIDE